MRWYAAIALIGALALAGCASRGVSATAIDSSEAVPVDAATLWDPNAAKDPIVTYRLRLATEPTNPALHNNLGNLYVLRNWLEEGVAEYKKALDIDDRSPIVWNNLGTAYRKKGKTGAAMSAFEKATRVDPKYALAWYNIGTIYDERGDYDRAVEMYLKAATYKPEILEVQANPQVVNNHHLLAVKLRRFLEEGGNLALPLESMPE